MLGPAVTDGEEKKNALPKTPSWDDATALESHVSVRAKRNAKPHVVARSYTIA